MRQYSSEELCRIWLQCAQTVTWKMRETLLQHYGNASSAYAQSEAELAKVIPAKAAKELCRLRRFAPEKLAARLGDFGAEVVFREDASYPELLKNIKDAPQALFVRGTACADTRSVAIVGARRETRYGRTQAYAIAYDLAKEGVTIVSGLANGIDTAAHEGALAAGGRTVAVLGCGIDRVYPENNRELAQQIVAHGGAVISEFAPGSEPLAYRFPIRNRIISGMSAALLLIEGTLKSGALTTADYAADQGREVFALPGAVDLPGSAAPNKLLREGFPACTCAQDILEDMRWISLQKEAPQPGAVEDTFQGLSEIQKRIAFYLQSEPRRFEELCEEIGIAPQELSGELTLLELDGVIEARAGRIYALASARR